MNQILLFELKLFNVFNQDLLQSNIFEMLQLLILLV